MKRVRGVWFTLLVCAATASSLSAQQSIYMMVDSIAGDQAAPHKGEFRVNSVSFAASNTTTIGTGSTGIAAGKAVLGPVSVSMRFNAGSTPKFFKNVIGGVKLPSIEIRHYSSTGQMTYKTVFENVFLSKVAMEASDEAVQQIDFTYMRVKWFAPPDAAGVAPPVQVGCWDIALN
jgi:type VI protein secretion system component Hcp